MVKYSGMTGGKALLSPPGDQKRDWPRHRSHCRPASYRMARVEGRGVAVVAAREIQPGTRIISEARQASREPSQLRQDMTEARPAGYLN